MSRLLPLLGIQDIERLIDFRNQAESNPLLLALQKLDQTYSRPENLEKGPEIIKSFIVGTVKYCAEAHPEEYRARGMYSSYIFELMTLLGLSEIPHEQIQWYMWRLVSDGVLNLETSMGLSLRQEQQAEN